MRTTTLPTDSTERKDYPLADGCDAYFPAALAGIARHSFKVGAKHTGGELVHKRWLSGDHANCIRRHLLDLADMIAAGERTEFTELTTISLLDEANALAWRACALSQELHERYDGAPIAPAARFAEPPPGKVTLPTGWEPPGTLGSWIDDNQPDPVPVEQPEEGERLLAAPCRPGCIIHTSGIVTQASPPCVVPGDFDPAD